MVETIFSKSFKESVNNKLDIVNKTNEDTNKKNECKAKGWVWDEATKTCNPPKTEEKKVEAPPQEPKKEPTVLQGDRGYVPTGNILPNGSKEMRIASPEEYAQYRQDMGFSDRAGQEKEFGVLKDKFGELSGFTKGGQTFGGINPQQTRRAVEGIAAEQELEVEGQAEQVLSRRQAELQAQGVDFAGQIGDSPDEQQMQIIRANLEQAGLDHVAALASSAPSLVEDFVYGAGAVAAFTKGKTKGLAPVAAGVGNAILGVFRDYVRDITGQRRETIETPIRTLTESKGVMTAIIGMQNSNPQSAQENLDAYNVVRTTIDMEYEHLKELSDSDLNKFLGENAINQMKEYEVYYLPFGERWQFDQEFANALANPDPTNTQIPFDIQQLLKLKLEDKQ